VETETYRDTAALEAGLDHVRRSPKDDGVIELVTRRPGGEQEHQILAEAEIDLERGLVGDRWYTSGGTLGMQLTLMNCRTADLVAGSRERWALAGDQLYVDFDLSVENLPAGTHLALGSAEVEVTGVPHRGCKKFLARFGLDAMKFVNSERGYALNLRGINTRVVRSGTVRPGDAIRKLATD
jgi:hypothetical protein